MEALKIRNLTKKYKDLTAVDDLNLIIHEGELFSLLGLNGAGKSTTIKMLSGLSKPTSGDAFILGRSIVREPDAAKAFLAVSPQETAVAPKLSVKENLVFMCGAYGLDRKKSKEQTEKITEAFHLEEILNKKACKLSGGWQRRLSIAMALIGEPKVLFLDEPTLGLDVIARNELWELIRRMKGEITIILTTHYMEEAETLSDRIAIMKNGKIAALGTPDELKAETGSEKFDEAFIKIIKEARL